MDQCRPRGVFLPVTELPGHHMGTVIGHQDAVPVEIGAIQHQIPVDLTGGLRCWWGDAPTPSSAAIEAALTDSSWHQAGAYPVEKPAQLMTPSHIRPTLGSTDTGPAGWIFAPKPLGTAGCFAIGTRGTSTYITFGFSSSKRHLHRLPPMAIPVLPHDRARQGG